MADTDPAMGELHRKAVLLQGFVKSSIDDVSQKRKLNQTKATSIKLAILFLSGAATILLGLDLGQGVEGQIKNCAFVLTSLVTVLNALEPFFNYRSLWVEHERARAAFYALKDRLQFYLEGRTEHEFHAVDLNRFYREYEEIWLQLNQAWDKNRRGGQGDDDGKGK